MYIIIGLALICATIGFVVGSAVRLKFDMEKTPNIDLKRR